MRRILTLAALIIAGEMVFGPAFHVPRFFLPTMLDVFKLTNTQLGDITAIYGITATLSFFPGGALADRYSARALISLALIATAAGGLYMATIPGPTQLAYLYGYFGVTTIFFLWGALIRATREWGGTASQGVAFGTLEAGRGLAAALVASLGVLFLASFMPDDANLTSDAARRAGLQSVIYLYAGVAFAAGVFAWFVVPKSDIDVNAKRNLLSGMLGAMRRPLVWLQTIVVISAYCLFKGTDYYSLYAQQALGYDELAAAGLASKGAYIRVLAALAAGFLADRFGTARLIAVAFALSAAAYFAHTILTPDKVAASIIIANAAVVLFAVIALRATYFALLEETRTPMHITGAAVGLISVVGFTPDIFIRPIAGRILDATPGVDGHMNLFLLLAAIAAAGTIAVACLLWVLRNKSQAEPVSSNTSTADAGS